MVLGHFFGHQSTYSHAGDTDCRTLLFGAVQFDRRLYHSHLLSYDPASCRSGELLKGRESKRKVCEEASSVQNPGDAMCFC